MFFEVRHAQFAFGHTLQLEFEDGSTGKVDLARYIQKDTVFAKLEDMDYLKGFRIEYGTLVWGDGELDIAPEALYIEATGKAISFRAKHGAIS